MNLVFLGPPGAGKGTQSHTVIERLNIVQISTGDTIRAAIREQSEAGRQAEATANAGKLVPDALINTMVAERLTHADCADGFLLDGYPRTVPQAEALDAMLASKGRKLDHVLLFEVEDSVLLERITGRRSDPDTGRVYHIRFDPPPPEVADRVIQRTDDTPEVLQARLDEYHTKTALLVPYYQRKGLLRRVPGSGGKDAVSGRIQQALGLNASDQL
jgi:adenylate kinase